MASGRRQIITNIIGLLRAIEDENDMPVVERIYRKGVLVEDLDDVIEQLTDNDGHINYWTVRRRATDPQSKEVNPEVMVREQIMYVHMITVDFWYAYYFESGESLEEDTTLDSQERFDRIVDLVLDNMLEERSLTFDDVEGTWSTLQPLRLIDTSLEFGPGSQLCHHAEFILTCFDPQEGLAPR